MRSGISRVRGITQFYLPPTRSSTNGMNHFAFSSSIGSRSNSLIVVISVVLVTAWWNVLSWVFVAAKYVDFKLRAGNKVCI